MKVKNSRFIPKSIKEKEKRSKPVRSGKKISRSNKRKSLGFAERRQIQIIFPAFIWLWKKLNLKNKFQFMNNLRLIGERDRVKIREFMFLKKKRMVRLCFSVLKNPRLAERQARAKQYTRPVISNINSNLHIYI